MDECDNILNINCPILEKADSFKYLGITLNKKLGWKKYITDLHNKIKFLVRNFYYSKNFSHLNFLKSYTLL